MRVKCIEKGLNSFLTVGNYYETILRDREKYYLKNDMGREGYYDVKLFTTEQAVVQYNGTGNPFYVKNVLYKVHSETANEYFLENSLGNREWVAKKFFTLYYNDEEKTVETKIEKEIEVHNLILNAPTEAKGVEQRDFVVVGGWESLDDIDINTRYTLTGAKEKIKEIAAEDGLNSDGCIYHIVKIEASYETLVTEVATYDVELKAV